MNKLGNSKKLSESEVKDYLKEYSRIISELGSEDNRVLRTGNNPIGDYGEWLVAKKLNLELYPSSEKSFDAYSGKLKYQIKSRQRRILPDKKGNRNLSRQLGVIRNYDEADVENKYLIALFFESDFSILEGYKISYRYLREIGEDNEHQNGLIINLSNKKIKEWIKKGKIEDITEKLK